MSTRYPRCVASCFFAGSLALFGQNASDFFELPGQGNPQARFVAYGAYPPQPQLDPLGFSKVVDASVAAGATQVIPVPDGSKIYVLASTGLQAWNGTLSSFLHNINGIAGTVQSVAVTPDGKYLLVLANHFYLLDVSTDAILATDPGFTGVATGFAFSHDSKTAWVIFNGLGSGLAPINLTTHSFGGRLMNFQYPVSSIALSPKGLLYV